MPDAHYCFWRWPGKVRQVATPSSGRSWGTGRPSAVVQQTGGAAGPQATRFLRSRWRYCEGPRWRR